MLHYFRAHKTAIAIFRPSLSSLAQIILNF